MSCADGSVILAKRWADVRCPGAVEGTPGNPPGLGPARRSGWPDKQAFRRGEEAARERDLESQIRTSRPATPPVLAAATLPPEPHRNLGLRIALSPTAVSLEGRGLPGRMRIAHSVAFEALLGGALAASRLGYVVLPAGFELDRPLTVFWGDEVTAVRWRR